MVTNRNYGDGDSWREAAQVASKCFRWLLPVAVAGVGHRCRGGSPESCPTDGSPPALQARLEALRDCAGIAGRDLPVDGRPFCE